jgi:hypothetical protein
MRNTGFVLGVAGFLGLTYFGGGLFLKEVWPQMIWMGIWGSIMALVGAAAMVYFAGKLFPTPQPDDVECPHCGKRLRAETRVCTSCHRVVKHDNVLNPADSPF